jgi:hypothetical protein
MDIFKTQFDAIKDGHPIEPDLNVVDVWNTKRKMSSMELSTLTPFACVFIILGGDITEKLKQRGYLKSGTYFKTHIEGFGSKDSVQTAVLLGATKTVYETPSLAGGLGIQNFEIGYTKTLTNLQGKFSLTVPSLEEFDEDFVASSLLSPFNILHCVYGWSGPNIYINLPWNSMLKDGIWRTSVESFNPGWWGTNTVYLYNRSVNPQGTSYQFDLTFVQTHTGIMTTPETGDQQKDAKSLTNKFWEIRRNFTKDMNKKVFNDSFVLGKESLYDDLEKCYQSYSQYPKDLLDKTWFTNIEDYKKTYGISRVNEEGNTEYVIDTIFYPLGLVIENLIISHFRENGAKELKKIFYASSEGLNLMDFEFELYDGEETITRTIKINSSFDIPLLKDDVDFILRKPSSTWDETINNLVSICPSIYRASINPFNKISDSENQIAHTHVIGFPEAKLEKEIKKKEKELPNSVKDLILDYRTQDSLVGEPQIEQSSVGLEKLVNPIVWPSLFGSESILDLGEDENTESKDVEVKKSSTPTNENRSRYFSSSIQDMSEQNTKLLANIFSDNSANRGVLIRSLSQTLNLDIHGTTGIFPLQLVWVRGLTVGMNGKHVVLGVQHNISPESFTTNLRLGNLNEMVEERFIRKLLPQEQQQQQQQEEKDPLIASSSGVNGSSLARASSISNIQTNSEIINSQNTTPKLTVETTPVNQIPFIK